MSKRTAAGASENVCVRVGVNEDENVGACEERTQTGKTSREVTAAWWSSGRPETRQADPQDGVERGT